MSAEDYCELCDLPKSQCIHGNPPPPEPARATTRAATPRTGTPRASGVRKKAAAPATSSRRVTRRWTPPDAFKPNILAVLREHGGAMEQGELFAALEAVMAERLSDADREQTPEGELRWRYAARRARQALIADGEMTKGRPGIWTIAD